MIAHTNYGTDIRIKSLASSSAVSSLKLWIRIEQQAKTSPPCPSPSPAFERGEIPPFPFREGG